MISFRKTVKNDYLQKVLLSLSFGAFALGLLFCFDPKKSAWLLEIIIPFAAALILSSLFAIRFFSISRTCNEKDELLCEIHNLSDYGNAYNVILHYRKDGRSYSKSQAIVKNSETEGLRNYSVVRAFCSGRNKRKVFVKNLYMDSDEKLDLFDEAPGLAPYFYNDGRMLVFGGKEYILVADGHRYTFLYKDKEIVMVIEPDVYLKKNGDKLLLWKCGDEIRFECVDIPGLCGSFSAGEIKSFYDDPAEPECDAGVLFRIKEGSESFKEAVLPIAKSGSYLVPELKEIGCEEKILFLARFLPDENQLNRNDVYCAVYECDFASEVLSVIPLRWFNEGSIDYGTMDPVRIARLKNGNFCLSGFRMLPLELDSAFNPHF